MKQNIWAQFVLTLGLTVLLVSTPSLAGQSEKLTVEEVQNIGVEAVVYGLPLVIMDLTRQVSTNVPGPQPNAHAPINQFEWRAKVARESGR
jgi:hypothetical protein